MILAILRSIAQLSDPAFFGTVLRSALWSVVGFAVLSKNIGHTGTGQFLHHFVRVQKLAPPTLR